MSKLLDFDESIFESIEHTQAYFDTVVLRPTFKSFLLEFQNTPLVEELKEINAPGSVALVRSKQKQQKKPWSHFLLDIKQPKRDTLLHLQRYLSEPPLITRVDPALDQIFALTEDAINFAVFLAQSLIQPWNRKWIKLVNEETAYSKQPERCDEAFESDDDSVAERCTGTTNRVCVIYATRGARFYHDEPCSHLEIRHTLANSVKRIGINTIADLLNFRFMEFFARELVLIWLRQEALDRLVRKMMGTSKRKQPVNYVTEHELTSGDVFTYDHFQRYKGLLCRRASFRVHGRPVISAHNLRRAAEDLGSKCVPKKRVFEIRMFERINTMPMLQLENVLAEGMAEQRA